MPVSVQSLLHHQDNKLANDINYDMKVKKVALTFDDGPHPTITRQLLDGLRDRDVKATFFVTGEHALECPKQIKQMQDDGHLIGNHTYHHVQLTTVGTEIFQSEITQTNEVIEEITGEKPEFIRPPYGSWDKALETQLNMLPVLWDVDPLDWCSTDAQQISKKVLSQVKENDIILMHDGYESSVTAAFMIVDELKRQGYEFVTVDELILD